MGHEGTQGEWACADSDTIAARLIEMRENQAAYRARALDAASMMRRDFSWQRAAERCIDLLESRYGLFEISLDI